MALGWSARPDVSKQRTDFNNAFTKIQTAATPQGEELNRPATLSDLVSRMMCLPHRSAQTNEFEMAHPWEYQHLPHAALSATAPLEFKQPRKGALTKPRPLTERQSRHNKSHQTLMHSVTGHLAPRRNRMHPRQIRRPGTKSGSALWHWVGQHGPM